MRILFGLSLLLAATALAVERPNIIVFLVDDYDKPETSCYGGKVLTPNLDRLAREGMLFHQAHVSSTVCTPSRYSFLTGRYAGSSHSDTYLAECPKGTQGAPAFNVSLEPDNMNIGRVLHDAGYATGYVGKFHVGHGGDHQGLEKNVPWTEALNRKKFTLEKQERALIQQYGFTWAKNIYWGNTKAPFQDHNPDWTIAAALEFVEAHRQQPFYLHYCTTLLHGPNGSWARSLEEGTHTTGEGRIDKPLELVDRQRIAARIEKAGLTRDEIGYLWMDETLGLLLDKLDALDLTRNTIVLFVADHGSNRKGSLFTQRGTEIPCLARWPAVIPPGSETHSLVQNIDFVPTWFAAAGATPPETYHLDGKSLLPVFRDPEATVRDFLYCEQGPVRAIKTAEWSYLCVRYTQDHVEAIDGNRGDRMVKNLLGLSGGISRAAADHPHAFDADQLYNLTRDPAERMNVAEKHPAVVERMQAQLRSALKGFPERPYGEFISGTGTQGPVESQAVLDQLRVAFKKSGKKSKR